MGTTLRWTVAGLALIALAAVAPARRLHALYAASPSNPGMEGVWMFGILVALTFLAVVLLVAAWVVSRGWHRSAWAVRHDPSTVVIVRVLLLTTLGAAVLATVGQVLAG